MLLPRGLRPPREVVRKPWKTLFQSFAAFADRLSPGVEHLRIGPTASVLDTTTIPISERMPCQIVPERTPEKRPAE